MSITKKDVEHVAMLARLFISEQEKELFTKQLGNILDHAGKISQLDTKKVKPTSHVLPIRNVLRKDEAKGSLSQKEALSNAPKEEDGFFVIPKIV